MNKVEELAWKAEKLSYTRAFTAIKGDSVRVLDIEPHQADAIGYTSAGKTVHLAYDHPCMKGLNKDGKRAFRCGVGVHELMHQLLTDFVIIERNLQTLPRTERKILGMISNYLEDARIEHYAYQFVGGVYLKCLEFAVAWTHKISHKLQEEDTAFGQYVLAIQQLGDMGFVKGHFTFPEAKKAFAETAPIFYQGMLETNPRRVMQYAKKIFEISRPLWEAEKDLEETLRKLMEEASKNGKTMHDSSSAGSHASAEAESEEDASDEKSARRKRTIKEVSRREYENASDGSSGGSGSGGEEQILKCRDAKTAEEAEEAAKEAEEDAADAEDAARDAQAAADEAKGTPQEKKAQSAADRAKRAAERARNAAEEAKKHAEEAAKAKEAGDTESEEASAKAAGRAALRANAAAKSAQKADDEANGAESKASSGEKTAQDASESAQSARESAEEAEEAAQQAESEAEKASKKKKAEAEAKAKKAREAADKAKEAADRAEEAAKNAEKAQDAEDEAGESANAQAAEKAARDAEREANKAKNALCDKPKPGEKANDAKLVDVNELSNSGSNFDSEVTDRAINGIRPDFTNVDQETLSDVDDDPTPTEFDFEDYALTDDDFASIETEIQSCIDNVLKEKNEAERADSDPLPEFNITSARIGKAQSCLNRKIAVDDVDRAMEMYGRLMTRLRPGVNSLYERLKNIFQNDLEVTDYRASGKLNYKRVNSGRLTARVFDKHRLPSEKAKTAVMILVDESGSMSGRNAETAKQTTISFAETFYKLNIPTYIIGFTADTSGHDVVHNHYVTWKNTINERLRLLDITARSNNFDGFSIRYGTELVKRINAEHKIMIVVSDGSPACCAYHYGADGIADTKDAIRQAKSNADVLGVLIGNSDVEEIKSMYGNDFIQVANVEDLFTKIARRLVHIVNKWD